MAPRASYVLVISGIIWFNSGYTWTFDVSREISRFCIATLFIWAMLLLGCRGTSTPNWEARWRRGWTQCHEQSLCSSLPHLPPDSTPPYPTLSVCFIRLKFIGAIFPFVAKLEYQFLLLFIDHCHLLVITDVRWLQRGSFLGPADVLLPSYKPFFFFFSILSTALWWDKENGNSIHELFCS
jgi:hypothetical protein